MTDETLNGEGGDANVSLDGGPGATTSSGAPGGAAGDGGDAAPASSWMKDQLSPANRAALEPKNFADNDALAAAYLNLEKTVGMKGVPLPGEDATPEEMNKFYEAIGRPAEPSEYVFAMPEGVEASQSDLAFQSGMAPVLHKAGLTQAQVAVLNEGWNEMNASAAQAYSERLDQEFTAAETALKKDLGAAYDAKMEAGNLAVRTLGGEELADYLAESGLGRDPRFLKFLVAAGESLSGDGALVDGNTVAGVSTPAQAKAEISRLESDPDFAKVFLDKSHPEYKAAVEKMQRLQALANNAGGS